MKIKMGHLYILEEFLPTWSKVHFDTTSTAKRGIFKKRSLYLRKTTNITIFVMDLETFLMFLS